MAHRRYRGQVELPINAPPMVATEPIFALKGGTAINLFYRNLPRLSVDMDMPVKDRAESLADIRAAMGRISEEISTRSPGTAARLVPGGVGEHPCLHPWARADSSITSSIS